MVDIYIIKNTVNDKTYVGQTKIGYKRRFNRHCRSYKYGVRTPISEAIHNIGRDKFYVELLKQVDDCDADYWESFYIDYYKSHYSVGGYNVTLGGKDNPMNHKLATDRHASMCHTPEFIEKQRQCHIGKQKSPETVQKLRESTLKNLDKCTVGFKAYNDSRRIPVKMLDEDGTVLQQFDSLSEACRYLGCTKKSYTSKIKQYADKFNKNGTRKKFLGYSWSLL